MFRSYNITTLATAFLVSLCIVVFCYIADPYKLYPAVPRLSPDASIDLFYVLRLHTPYEVERIRPSRLIVGNSRSAVLPPQLLQQPGEVAYNASLPGATLSELRRMVEHAHAIQPLQQVLVGLDLQMFEGDGTEKVFLDERARYRKVDRSGLVGLVAFRPPAIRGLLEQPVYRRCAERFLEPGIRKCSHQSGVSSGWHLGYGRSQRQSTQTELCPIGAPGIQKWR